MRYRPRDDSVDEMLAGLLDYALYRFNRSIADHESRSSTSEICNR